MSRSIGSELVLVTVAALTVKDPTGFVPKLTAWVTLSTLLSAGALKGRTVTDATARRALAMTLTCLPPSERLSEGVAPRGRARPPALASCHPLPCGGTHERLWPPYSLQIRSHESIVGELVPASSSWYSPPNADAEEPGSLALAHPTDDRCT